MLKILSQDGGSCSFRGHATHCRPVLQIMCLAPGSSTRIGQCSVRTSPSKSSNESKLSLTPTLTSSQYCCKHLLPDSFFSIVSLPSFCFFLHLLLARPLLNVRTDILRSQKSCCGSCPVFLLTCRYECELRRRSRCAPSVPPSPVGCQGSVCHDVMPGEGRWR
jgi:hypothetical protein